MASYRHRWLGVWETFAGFLEKQAQVAESLEEHLELALEWHDDLDEKLVNVGKYLLRYTDAPSVPSEVVLQALSMLGKVAAELRLEASVEGQTWEDYREAGRLARQLRELESDAGAFSVGADPSTR